jgi:hypothetical protein
MPLEYIPVRGGATDAAKPSFKKSMGMSGSDTVASIAGILRGAKRGTAKLAAGFSQDPAVRARYQGIIAQQEALDVNDRRQRSAERIRR